MNARQAVLIAIVAAATLAPAAATEPDVAKQRVAISAAILPSGTFVLSPLGGAPLERDAGSSRRGMVSHP